MTPVWQTKEQGGVGELTVPSPVFRGGGPGSIPTFASQMFSSHGRTHLSLLAFPVSSEAYSALATVLNMALPWYFILRCFIFAPLSARNRPVEVPTPHKVLVTQLV